MADYNSSYTGAQIDANLALAATAVQDADLATVATTGAYNDLTGKPTLGTAAAAATGDFATAAQGTLAATAVQPGDDAADLGSGAATDGYVLTADGAGGAAWEAASGGGGTPGGADTQVQFNDGGAFGGDSGFTFDKTNNTLGLGGGTITASDPIIDMAQTWNNAAVTFTAVKANVTDTASAATSLLMDLQVGGSSRFKVDKGGKVTLFDRTDISSPAANMFQVQSSGFPLFKVNSSSGVEIYGPYIGWNTYGQSTPDTYLLRDAANTLAQRNGVNAQAFNLYNTYTDASNYERLAVTWVGTSNIATIKSENAGTGASRAVRIIGSGSSFVGLDASVGAWLAVTGGYQINCDVSGIGLRGGGIGVPNVYIVPEAANVFSHRNGTNAQTSRLYGTYTDAANYRRLTKTMSTAGVAEIKPEGAGTGASGNVLHISGLPTSNPGPGILWNNAGTPAIGT